MLSPPACYRGRMQKGCLALSLLAQMTEGNLRTESAWTTDSVGHSRKQKQGRKPGSVPLDSMLSSQGSVLR